MYPLFPYVEHRSTSFLYLTLLGAMNLISGQLFRIISIFLLIILLQAGLLLLNFPCGLYSRIIRVMSCGFFLSVYDPFSFLMTNFNVDVHSYLVVRRSSRFLITFGQNLLRICRRHLFTKVWSFFVHFVTFQFSQPYSSIDLTQVLNRRNLCVCLTFLCSSISWVRRRLVEYYLFVCECPYPCLHFWMQPR